MLDHARRYNGNYGWSIIPIRPGTKAAACAWTEFQQTRPTDEQLAGWFGNGRSCGLAVIFGDVSDGLICRDFDTLEGYQQWAAEHPDLAATLPTVETARGRHVYCRSGHRGIVKMDDGELRGAGYCLLPPSRHPSGLVYRWLIPPDGDIPSITDTRAAGFLRGDVTERAERTEDNGGLQSEQKQLGGVVDEGTAPPTNCPVLSVHSVLSVTRDSDPEIDRAILDTIPSAIGRRNRQVFELARALKGIPRLADGHVDALKPYVRQWHKVGLNKGVIGTEPLEETWIDFLHAWPKVKFPKGEEPMLAIFQRAKDSPLPRRYEGKGLRLLMALCRELQRSSGDKPFFLACRTAAWLLDLGQNGHMKAWRWLDLLVHDHVLEEVEKGARGKRRATRYRYIEDDL